MSETRIKICGLRRMEDIIVANEYMPEYIGFIFACDRKRCIHPDLAANLRKMMKPGILATGVFVDEKIETIAEIAKRGIIDVIQLHGSEDNDYLQELKRVTGKKIIKAFEVHSAADIEAAEASAADLVLLDAGKGSGKTFDWELLKSVKRPYILAGGLNSTNVVEAIHKLHPLGVDVSSGIESDGYKDPYKIKQFIEAVRKA